MHIQHTSPRFLAHSVSVSSKSFMKANSRHSAQHAAAVAAADIERGSTTETYTEETFGPLSNVRFAVFALGSSAYPNFCEYGKYVDSVLGDLGGERLTKCAYGDEMCGQEHAFRQWAPDVFKVACETFCLDSNDTLTDAKLAMQNDALTVDTVRLVPVNERQSLEEQLNRYYNKRTVVGQLKHASTSLHTAPSGGEANGSTSSVERSTILVEIQANGVSDSAYALRTFGRFFDR